MKFKYTPIFDGLIMAACLLVPAAVQSQSLADLQPWVNEKIRLLTPVSDSTGREIKQTGQWNGFSILVCHDPEGQLIHAGIRLDERTGNEIIHRFLERLALSEQILPFHQVSNYLASQQMVVISGKSAQDRFLTPASLTELENGWLVRYRSGWELQVPPNYLPLSGLEKEALDNQMARLIRKPSVGKADPVVTSGNLIRLDSTVWLGGFFRTSWHMNGRPVWSALYPRESLLTMIADFRGQGGMVPVQVTHHTYGNQVASYRAAWEGVADGVLAGSEIWMAEELDPNGFTTVTVLAVDRVFRHLHMMVLKVRGNMVSETNSVIQADLYTYIRQDNVTSWLKTHDGTHGGLNIKVIR